MRLLATDPSDGRYIGLIRSTYERTNPNDFRAAIAYATHSGVAELNSALADLPGWNEANKRWLVGIDYCRSDPVALAHLDDLPHSDVRVFDGRFVSGRRGCVPRSSYHPKAYLLKRGGESSVVVGSGNLSLTGLRKGIEAAAFVSPEAREVRNIRAWFSRHWRQATPFGEIRERYERQYDSVAHRLHPNAVEDDAVPESASRRGQLRPVELRKLRVCRHLWIEAGNLHHNRGRDQPGNQLMLTRNSRVFFGFPADDLPRDSLIGNVAIRTGEHLRRECSFRFSNNHMDVLTLPIPGVEGPAAYDQKTLHFEHVGVRKFELEIGSQADVSRWKRRSRAIEGDFRMRSGRRWGVY